MKTTHLKPVLEWLKTTDISEALYQKGKLGFELSFHEDSPDFVPSELLKSRFLPICAQAVGFFHFHRPGETRLSHENAPVQTEDILGIIDPGTGQAAFPIKAPKPGRIARILVEADQPVEYGQPLFFLECEAP